MIIFTGIFSFLINQQMKATLVFSFLLSFVFTSIVFKPCIKLCIIGFHCVNGDCVPESQCINDSHCKSGQACQSGTCKQIPTLPGPKPCFMHCILGYHCENGQCVPDRMCSINEDCGVSQKCLGNICFDKCSGVECPKGKICIQGKCRNQDCKKIDCPNGTFCKNGKCQPNINVCPSNSIYQTKVCTNPRPNQKTCPTLYYFRAPDLAFCGVKADGTRVSFAEECSTCKDSSILYYFTTPCHKVPFICNNSDTCTGQYCSSFGCSVSQDCPYDWQICSQKKCIDRCAVMKCSGLCKFGQCNFQQANGHCSLGVTSGCKKKNWQCIGFECADLCLRKACPAYHICNSKSGSCQAIETR